MSSPEKRKKKTNRDFWRACRFFGPYRRIVAISMTCAVLAGFIMTSGIGALFPILQVLTKGDTVQAWVGRMVASHQPHVPWYLNLASQVAGLLPLNPVGTIAVLFIAIAVLGLIGNVFRFFQEYLSDKAAISAVQDIRKTLYDHVLHIPLEFFGMQGTSDVTSRLVQDCQGLQEGFKLLLGQGVQEPIKAGMALALAMCINWQLTVFIIACTPVMAIIMKKFGKKMRRASRAALQSNSEMLGQIEGSLAGVRVVKAANAERLERRRYVNIMAGLHREQLKMAR
ncbi:MAG TPA: ABC transporter transmembrane domain-containing protein, partial [Tepidisphaeraceae bacterium]|nr:ABC transporter transmembrane domain-containing protein [Tepidisphaeraceae bacterium]